MEMYAKKVNTELKSFLIKLIAERKRGKVGKNSNEPWFGNFLIKTIIFISFWEGRRRNDGIN